MKETQNDKVANNFFDLDMVEPFIGADGTDYEGLSARVIRNDSEKYPFRVQFYDNGEEIEEFKCFCPNLLKAINVANNFFDLDMVEPFIVVESLLICARQKDLQRAKLLRNSK